MPDSAERDLWWEFLAGSPESKWNPPAKMSKRKAKRMGLYPLPDDPGPDSQLTDAAVADAGVDVQMEEALPATETGEMIEALVEPRILTPSLLKHIDEVIAHICLTRKC